MQTIQLPTSTGLLLDQTFRAYKFTKHFDVNHPGPAEYFPRFLATFNKEAELERLSWLAAHLANGADVGIYVDEDIVDALKGLRRLGGQ